MLLIRLLFILTLFAETAIAHENRHEPWVTRTTAERYREFADYFNRELAGRFPFGDLASSDVSMAAVQSFISDRAPQIDALRADVAESEPSESMATAARFLGDLSEIAAFLRHTTVAPDSLQLRVTFNHPVAQARGTDQLVTWRFTAGQKSVSHPAADIAGDQTLNWSASQPIMLELTWAERSSVRPRPDNTAPVLQVEGRVARILFQGNWALLRLLQSRDRIVSIVRGETPAEHFVTLSVPAHQLSDSNAAQTSYLQAPLSLQTQVRDPHTAAMRWVAVPQNWPRRAPEFPTRPAPTLDQTRARPRVLLISAPSANHPAYRDQAALLLPEWAGLTDRDCTVVTVFGAESFSVVLIGKDGEEKLRRTAPLKPEELFAIVDAMPMRRAELRQRDDTDWPKK